MTFFSGFDFITSFEDGLKLVKLRGEAMQVTVHGLLRGVLALCPSC